MPSAADSLTRRGGRARAPATILLAVALVAVYFGLQQGPLTAGVARTIEFRCNTVDYGLIPYEIAHPGARLTDPYCQPQPQADPGHDEHEHARSDPGIVADAPTVLTPLSAMLMHGGVMHLAGSLVLLLLFGPRLEARIGPWRLVGLFLAAGLASEAALVALTPDLPIATIGAAGAVAGVIAGHAALFPIGRLTGLALLVFVQVLAARSDAAQPVAGLGGDVAYVVPGAGLLVGLLLGLLVRGAPGRRVVAML